MRRIQLNTVFKYKQCSVRKGRPVCLYSCNDEECDKQCKSHEFVLESGYTNAIGKCMYDMRMHKHTCMCMRSLGPGTDGGVTEPVTNPQTEPPATEPPATEAPTEAPTGAPTEPETSSATETESVTEPTQGDTETTSESETSSIETEGSTESVRKSNYKSKKMKKS